MSTKLVINIDGLMSMRTLVSPTSFGNTTFSKTDPKIVCLKSDDDHC